MIRMVEPSKPAGLRFGPDVTRTPGQALRVAVLQRLPSAGSNGFITNAVGPSLSPCSDSSHLSSRAAPSGSRGLSKNELRRRGRAVTAPARLRAAYPGDGDCHSCAFGIFKMKESEVASVGRTAAGALSLASVSNDD